MSILATELTAQPTSGVARCAVGCSLSAAFCAAVGGGSARTLALALPCGGAVDQLIAAGLEAQGHRSQALGSAAGERVAGMAAAQQEQTCWGSRRPCTAAATGIEWQLELQPLQRCSLSHADRPTDPSLQATYGRLPYAATTACSMSAPLVLPLLRLLLKSTGSTLKRSRSDRASRIHCPCSQQAVESTTGFSTHRSRQAGRGIARRFVKTAQPSGPCHK